MRPLVQYRQSPGHGWRIPPGPPITISADEIEEGLGFLDEAFGHVLDSKENHIIAADGICF